MALVVREVVGRMNLQQTASAPDQSPSKVETSAPSPSTPSENDGLFRTAEDAIKAAQVAQKNLVQATLARRRILIEAMRNAALEKAEELGALAVSETGLGRAEDKVQKIILAAQKTPGLEDVEPTAYTGDHGFTLVERAPYGVIGAITPSTNPASTIVNNGIAMIAAGNAVVFNPHPAAKRVSRMTIEILHRAIVREGGPAHTLSMVADPTKATGEILMHHPDVRILVVTGGPVIVGLAMKCEKRVIAAGPGNPPVVVDETADIERAAKDIVDGASFDNGVLCTAEKEVFVVEVVADQLLHAMKEHGAIQITLAQVNELMEKISIKSCSNESIASKEYVGKDVGFVLKAIGVQAPAGTRLAIVEVDKNHPLVHMEQLMPILPVVRVATVEEGIQEAYRAEAGNFHTAVMHSKKIDNLSNMAKTINTTLFVKNAPSYAGLGMMGEGFTSFTLASPTGEGVTSPISFTRQRRCVLKDYFRIV